MLAHANILASTTTLYTLIPLSLTFTKKKGEPPVKPKHKHVLCGDLGVL